MMVLLIRNTETAKSTPMITRDKIPITALKLLNPAAALLE